MTLFFITFTYIGLFWVFIKSINYIQKDRIEIKKIVEPAFVYQLAVVLLFVSFLPLIYHSYNKTYYCWDMTFYWEKTILLKRAVSDNSLLKTLSDVYQSIIVDDYTLVPPVFLMPLFNLLGESYTSYVLTINIIFYVPSVLMFLLLIDTLLKRLGYSSYYHYIIALLLFFPFNLFTMLQGYYDVVGVPFCCLLLFFAIQSTFEKVDFKLILLLSTSIVLLLFTRRWYSFWIVSFFISYPLALSYKFIVLQKDRVRFKNLILSFLIITLLVGGTLFLFFRPFVIKSFSTNYSDIYSAFSSSRIESFSRILNHFGLLTLGLSIVGIYKGYKNEGLKYYSIANVLQVILIFFLFTRIQDFGPHHYFLFLPMVTTFSIVGCYVIIKELRAWRVAVLGLWTLSFLSYFVPSIGENTKSWLKVLGENRWFYPTVRKDLRTIDKIVDDLNAVLKEGDYVYVLSSSHTFNDDLLRKSKLPDMSNSIKGLLNTSHIDKRDGFPLDFFRAKYVVVANPLQLHQNREGQQVVEILQSGMMDPNSIRKGYKPIASYRVGQDNEIEVILFEKIAPLPYGEVKRISNFLKNTYPEYPNLQLNNILRASSYYRVENAVIPHVFWDYNEALHLYPGENNPTEVIINTAKVIRELSLKISAVDKQAIIDYCDETKEGEVKLTVLGDDRVLYEQYLTWRDELDVKLDLTNVENLIFRVDKGNGSNTCDHFMLKDIKY